MSVCNSGWEIARGWGLLRDAGFSCDVELARPDRGLQQLHGDGAYQGVSRLLAITASPPPPASGETIVESYVRGRDLVVQYAQTPARSVRWQVYWQSLERVAGVQLVLSVQTNRLVSDPGLWVQSEFAAVDEVLIGRGDAAGVAFESVVEPGGSRDQEGGEKCFPVDVNCVLFRLAGSSFTYCEMIYPADCPGITLRRDGASCRLGYRMFAPSLEKGVIRRGRVRGVFVPRRHDCVAVSAQFEQLCREALPLTV